MVVPRTGSSRSRRPLPRVPPRRTRSHERSVEHKAGRGPPRFQCAASDLSEARSVTTLVASQWRRCTRLLPCQCQLTGVSENRHAGRRGRLGELRPVREEDGHGVTFTSPRRRRARARRLPGIQLGEAALPLPK